MTPRDFPARERPQLFNQLVGQFADRLEGQAPLAASLEHEQLDKERWKADPFGWITTHLNVAPATLKWSLHPAYANHKWDGTPDPFMVVLDSLAQWKNVGVEAGTGTNKTFTAACIALWFLDVFPEAQVITLAPKEDQLKLHLWKEVGRLWPRFQRLRPQADKTDLRIRIVPGSDAWLMIGFPVGVGAGEESATKAQGFHAEHMLFIMEEMPGQSQAIANAVDNTCTAPHNLRLGLGNPDNTLDTLHQFCTSAGVVHVRVSGLDHPNVVAKDPGLIPGAVSQSQIDRRADQYGEDSPLYLSRVRGICPAEAAEALIKLSWCFDAVRRYEDDAWIEAAMEGAEASMGVDVANSKAGDMAAVARGMGPVLRSLVAKPCPRADDLAPEVIVACQMGLNPERVGVDATGVGAALVNPLRLANLDIQALHSSGAPTTIGGMEERFLNLRAQMWYQLRLDLMHGRIALPRHEELFRDLTTPAWGTRNGKIYVEAKEDIKKRLGRSPNLADAVVYWNWVRSDRGASIGGGLVDF